MNTRTLSQFCKENSISIKDIAEKTGIAEGALRYADKTDHLPLNIGEKIAAAYNLPSDYFSEDIYLSEYAPAKREFGHFIKLSFDWGLSIEAAVAATALLFLIVDKALSRFIFAELKNYKIYELILTVLFSAAVILVVVLLCNRFADKFESKNKITGSIRKYRFLYFQLSLNAAAMIRLIPAATDFFFEENEIINKISSITIMLAVLFLAAFLMNAAYAGEKEAERAVKILLIFGLISSIIAEPLIVYLKLLYEIKNYLSAYSFKILIPAAINAVSFAVLASGLIIGAKKKPHLEKLRYTVLPIIQIAVSIIISTFSIAAA